MHGAIDEAGIAVKSLHISGTVIPVNAKSVHRRVRVVGLDVQELHDPAEVVRVTRRLTDKIHVICSVFESA